MPLPIHHDAYAGLPGQGDQAPLIEDLRSYFGPHAPVFLATYEKIHTRRGLGRMMPLTWSWQLLFTSYAWLYYRKLWITATLAALVLTIAMTLPPLANNGFSLALTLLMSLYGKPWYVRVALSQIAKADRLGLRGDSRRRYLMQAGGTSPLAAGIASVAMAMLFIWSIWPVLLDNYALLTALNG
jgi:hypothetical protein